MTGPLYHTVIGTGGIGSGIIFCMDSDRPLNRSESRLADLSSARDYCKQHIILHYIAKCLSPEVAVHAIGMVGGDEQGCRLLREMQAAGIETSMVQKEEPYPTMFSVCLAYPDKSVCNVTSGNSACNRVTAAYIGESLKRSGIRIDGKTMILAVPEVPLNARLALLAKGRERGAFCAASFSCAEAAEFAKEDGIALCNLISINEEEAAAVSGSAGGAQSAAEAAYGFLRQINPEIKLIVTCGSLGSYSFFNGNMEFTGAKNTTAVSTAGAGDAYIAGVLCGLIKGLPFQKGGEKENIHLPPATELGAYFAALSVKSRHTIAEEIDKTILEGFLKGDRHV